MNTILWYNESVWPDVWPKNKCRSLWPIFHGQVILPYILKTIWCMNFILQDYESVWPDIWPEINVGHCDLYFMVQWFCLKSWKLFSSWTSYFGTMSKYDPTSDLKIFIGYWDLYFMVQWFCLASWRLFDVWSLYFCNNVMRLLPWNNVGHSDPFFHGPVILPYIVNSIWWVTTILCDKES